jgi:transposase
MGKVFSQEFKDQIVALHRLKGRTCTDLAKEFDLSSTTVSNWVRAADQRERAQRTLPTGESDQQRIRRLELELARKDEELEILGKALAFFAKRQDP